MKKLTLEQALKTPNIAFDVTPEQINEINRTTNRELSYKCVAVRTKQNCAIEYVDYKDGCYQERYIPNLVEIIEEESNTFNSQQEVWQWLAEGNKCLWKLQDIYGFKNEVLWNFTYNRKAFIKVANINNWTKYKELEYIIVNGFEVPKPIKELSELKLANLLIEEGIHSNSENAYIHAQAMLGCIE
jgi:hypothetical protein